MPIISATETIRPSTRMTHAMTAWRRSDERGAEPDNAESRDCIPLHLNRPRRIVESESALPALGRFLSTVGIFLLGPHDHLSDCPVSPMAQVMRGLRRSQDQNCAIVVNICTGRAG